MPPQAGKSALQGDFFAPHLPEGLVYRPAWVDVAGQKRLLARLAGIEAMAPLARARTRNGLTSAAMTNCGRVGWWSDLKGYRYEPVRPPTGRPWPPMPEVFLKLVSGVVADTPWARFTPDACLINFYAAGTKMGLHQDRDEKDFSQPIVTVCLGDDADFMIGGIKRADKTQALVVRSGDVLIMGGESRLRFHGVRKIYPGTSPLPSINGRYSLTFRKAL
ncbi:MAG: alpha-ketoglutarate-dependent dioxygenase AlkB [Rhodospirillaceae bacterium]|nr:alpha-ketoglutarate-dependent dioxygenase AlkB [Rhodospirillaceae bacterium]